MDNKCLMCGEIIPEGYQVCGICKDKMLSGTVKTIEVSIQAPEPHKDKKCGKCYHWRFCASILRDSPCSDYIDAALVVSLLNAIPKEVRKNYENT